MFTLIQKILRPCIKKNPSMMIDIYYILNKNLNLKNSKYSKNGLKINNIIIKK